jgi:Flp pilus assembly protein TadG
MVEFALVLPLLLAIIFMSIAVGILYAVRIDMQKTAYDAARHVAKTDSDLDNDLIKGCYPENINGNGTKNFDQYGEARRVIKFHRNTSQLQKSMVENEANVDFISAGAPLNATIKSGGGSGGATTGGDSYYCSTSVVVQISYTPSIPGWSVLQGLYGSNVGTLRETGVAARLQGQYEPPVDKPSPSTSPSTSP